MQISPYDKQQIETSIPDRFSEQVRRHPNKVAVSDSGTVFTYRRLNDQSNQIANAILALRGVSEEPIGILFQQGYAPIVSILGVLKAGKIYVAMDPSETSDQSRRIIQDSQPGLIITNTKHESLAHNVGHKVCETLNIETIPSIADNRNPNVLLSADSLAYIFYTSGSTGPPKGVFDCHRNVLHNVMRYHSNLGFVPSDRHSLIQSPTFSGTVSSMFSALLSGATLCPFDLQKHGIERLARWLNSEQITIFHSVPSIFDQLLGSGFKFESLRIIRLEGDQSLPRHVREFKRRFSANCILANGLGTTETGLIRQFKINPDMEILGQSVPVGYEIEDMIVRLTNDDGDEVLNGEIGEIAVRSSYLAKGYWQRPQLTANIFTMAPNEPEKRDYRTGDLGRWLPDGCLEYIGRSDRRSKIRGRRIDTVEVADLLRQFPSIEHALVMVREDIPGFQQLVAYLLVSQNQQPSVSEARRFLVDSLPASSIPAKFVFLDRFPTDRNGKVDRRALPIPSRERPMLEQVFVAPASLRQKAIADCFGAILKIEQVGLYDNFFELGGDSLLATELLLLLNENLGVSCSPGFLFGEGSVFAVDRDIARDIQSGCVVKMQGSGDLAPLFCMHDNSGNVLAYRELARLLGPGRPVFGVQFSSVNLRAGERVRLEAMAKKYVNEIKKTQPIGPYHVCGHCFGGLVAFEVARQLRMQGQNIALLALIDTSFPAGLLSQLVARLQSAMRRLKASQLSVTELPEFAVGRIRGFFKWIVFRAKVRLQHARARIYMLCHRGSKPVSMDPRMVCNQSMLHYRPQSYDGDITLICPGPPHDHLGWQQVASLGFELIEIPVAESAYNRPHLITEPHVAQLAKAMRSLLEKSV